MAKIMVVFMWFGVCLFTTLCVAEPVVPAIPANLLVEIKGDIYPKDSIPAECANMLSGVPCAKPSYGHFHVVSEKQNVGGAELTSSTATFADPEGIQVIEKTWDDHGAIKKGSIENKQLGLVAEMEVVGTKVKYKVKTSDGKIKTEETNAEDNLVMPSTLMAYLRPRFDEVMMGKVLQVKMAVLDRLDSFTFNLKKIKEDRSASGAPMAVLQLSPASFFVSAVVDPIYFYVNLDSRELITLEGRSALRRKIKGKFKEMDVRVVYHYLTNAFKKPFFAHTLKAVEMPGCSAIPVLNNGLKQDPKCQSIGVPDESTKSKK